MYSDIHASERDSFGAKLGDYFIHGLILLLPTWFLLEGPFLVIPHYLYQVNLVLMALSVAIVWFIAGIINVTISELIYNFKSRGTAESFFYHGFILSISLQLLWIPKYTITILIPTEDTRLLILWFITSFIMYSVLFGYVGRRIAGQFPELVVPNGSENSASLTPSRIVIRGTRGRCPRCGFSSRYRSSDLSTEGTVDCSACGKPFPLEPIESLLRRLGDDNESDFGVDL